mmetsp:Transcript_36632/g.56285  ORF Transcript_36632/g.56285 Transcript_36632/m.56285 type:complete len:140 (+) Transcript_36632:91-510(+)
MKIVTKPFILIRTKQFCLVRCRLLSSTSDSTKNQVPLSRGDLARLIAQEHQVSVAKGARILNTVFDTITESLANKQEVRISSFGGFKTVESKGRMGRNPNSGEPIYIPTKQRVRFTAYSALKGTLQPALDEEEEKYSQR